LVGLFDTALHDTTGTPTAATLETLKYTKAKM